MTQPEVWLRGALPDYIDELQPVAHSLLQVREEIEGVTSLTAAQLWARPGGAASVGFHLRHLAGSLDRLMTYARGKPLNVAQYEYLAGEEHERPGGAQQHHRGVAHDEGEDEPHFVAPSCVCSH